MKESSWKYEALRWGQQLEKITWYIVQDDTAENKLRDIANFLLDCGWLRVEWIMAYQRNRDAMGKLNSEIGKETKDVRGK